MMNGNIMNYNIPWGCCSSLVALAQLTKLIVFLQMGLSHQWLGLIAHFVVPLQMLATLHLLISIAMNLVHILPTHLGFDCSSAISSIRLVQMCYTFITILVSMGNDATCFEARLTSQLMCT